MLFKKPLSKLEYSDLEKLKSDKTTESEILEYKKEYNEKKAEHENKLLKVVASFSNSNGGFLIYGIEETGSGGYPKKIFGIDKNINLETFEQIIISNSNSGSRRTKSTIL
ncbi:MAG: ATP-binding protein [ANME-2 cluster archaeon]|nr:ATP-binding protein [ANME-2 cluster archaeon]MBC2702476.1 ATP-binding protein [ANME-2 cluster archaeon]MBC2707946.1 ATP-binding protein [ANME-2 cluster archaeon]MBC2747023.1 ATP-binding protein [ANME-2 cluster archaeon]